MRRDATETSGGPDGEQLTATSAIQDLIQGGADRRTEYISVQSSPIKKSFVTELGRRKGGVPTYLD